MDCMACSTDVLVLGTGGAGLVAAVEAAKSGAKVLVVSKMGPADTNCTISAWGGLTYAPESRVHELFRQVVETGGYLVNQRLVEVFAHRAPQVPQWLAGQGVAMDVLGEADRKNQLGIVKLRGTPGTTGSAITKPLRAKAEALGAKFLDRVMISTLVTEEGRIAGAVGADLRSGKLLGIAAKAVVLATGGGACLFERHDNPPGATADGIALAYTAGAELVDMECISFQFPDNRLAGLFAVKEPPDKGLLRVGAAHYYLGGVRIDERTRTSVDGFFAAGETTGGVFGAARLGGAALSDTLVFGAIAGKEAANTAMEERRDSRLGREPVDRERQRLEKMLAAKGPLASEVTAKLRAAMWRHAGTMKTRQTLEQAGHELDALEPLRTEVRAADSAQLRDALEFANLLTVARLIVAASLRREESRGCFWRLDFPKPDNAKWVKNIHQWQSAGKEHLAVRPAALTRLTQPAAPRIGAGCFSYLPQSEA